MGIGIHAVPWRAPTFWVNDVPRHRESVFRTDLVVSDNGWGCTTTFFNIGGSMILLLLTESWFWIMSIGLILILTADASENGIFITFALAAIGLLLWWISDIPIFQWIKDHPKEIALSSLAWFPIGTLWATFKWYLYVLEKRRSMVDRKGPYIKSHGQDSWDKYVEDFMPKARDIKWDIIRWICYWPLSMINAILQDLLKAIGEHIYNFVGDFFNNISKKMFKDV